MIEKKPKDTLIVFDFDGTLITLQTRGSFEDNKQACLDSIVHKSELAEFIQSENLEDSISVATFGYNVARVSLVVKEIFGKKFPLPPIIGFLPTKEVLSQILGKGHADFWSAVASCNSEWGGDQDLVKDIYQEFCDLGLKEFLDKLKEKLDRGLINIEEQLKNFHIAFLVKLKNKQWKKENNRVQKVILVDDQGVNLIAAKFHFALLAEILDDEELRSIQIETVMPQDTDGRIQFLDELKQKYRLLINSYSSQSEEAYENEELDFFEEDLSDEEIIAQLQDYSGVYACLNLESNSGITDKTVDYLVERASGENRLFFRELRLGSTSITDEGIRKLVNYKPLKTLSVSGNDYVSFEALKALLENNNHIIQIEAECEQITKENLTALIKLTEENNKLNLQDETLEPAKKRQKKEAPPSLGQYTTQTNFSSFYTQLPPPSENFPVEEGMVNMADFIHQQKREAQSSLAHQITHMGSSPMLATKKEQTSEDFPVEEGMTTMSSFIQIQKKP